MPMWQNFDCGSRRRASLSTKFSWTRAILQVWETFTGLRFCFARGPTLKLRVDLSDAKFDAVWKASVKLMRTGFETGRITSLTKAEATKLGDEARRRCVYNQARCIFCSSSVSSWKESGRTVWACLDCQSKPRVAKDLRKRKRPLANKKGNAHVFFSHCAKEPLDARRLHPSKLLVTELRAELKRFGYPISGKKEVLVARLQNHLDDMLEHTADFDASDNKSKVHGYNKRHKHKR